MSYDTCSRPFKNRYTLKVGDQFRHEASTNQRGCDVVDNDCKHNNKGPKNMMLIYCLSVYLITLCKVGLPVFASSLGIFPPFKHVCVAIFLII